MTSALTDKITSRAKQALGGGGALRRQGHTGRARGDIKRKVSHAAHAVSDRAHHLLDNRRGAA